MKVETLDTNGNTVSKVEGSKRWTYTWDYENRLTQAWDRKTRVRYSYDALGRRVERNLGFGRERTRFTYDGEDVLLDDANGTQTKYLNGPGIDNKLSLKTGSAVNYFLADHLGSTNGLADATGSLTAQIGYDAFGNATNPSFPSRYQFTGRERDDFTGLMHYRARHYDPKLGRFISEDPISFAGGDVNLYGYVGNRPLARRDPTGLFPNTIAADPGTTRLAVAALAAAGALAPPVGVAAVGGAAIYVSWQLGEEIARHPSNPLSRPWVSPDVIRPPLAAPVSRPYCQPKPRAIPLDQAPLFPRTRSEPRDYCDRQYEQDRQVCSRIEDSQMRGACYANAFDRWASCKAGRNLPHNPWPQYPWD